MKITFDRLLDAKGKFLRYVKCYAPENEKDVEILRRREDKGKLATTGMKKGA